MGEPTADRLTAARTALMIVDMQRYFVHPEYPFGKWVSGLVPGGIDDYFRRVRHLVIPDIQRLLERARQRELFIVFTEAGSHGPQSAAPTKLRGIGLIALHELWVGAGFETVETREITVSRTFVDFDDFWAAAVTAPSLASIFATMSDSKARVQLRLPANSTGAIPALHAPTR